MKKSIVVTLVVMAMMVGGATLANAATKILPAGAKVSATVSSDGMATISVSGVPDLEKVEYYAYEGIKSIDGNASINLREGRRFQVVFGGGLYALLTPEMAAVPHPEFFGQGVGLDCSNPGGCCFIVTGK